MAIRNNALKWFKEYYGESSIPIYTSKLYLPEESWTKSEVWWLEVPLDVVNSTKNDHIVLLCEISAEANEYYLLKVPLSFLQENMDRLYKRENKLSLYLSAQEDDIFIDLRGEGVDFISFVENIQDEGAELAVIQYEEGLVKLSHSQMKGLLALYSFPNSTATTKQLAAALDYNGFQASNRLIGSIGKTISNATGIIPPSYNSGHKNQPGYFLFVSVYDSNQGWVMWQNLKSAIENLGLNQGPLVSKEEGNPALGIDPDVVEEKSFREGVLLRYLANRFVRSRAARRACVDHFGAICSVCDFDFEKFYGKFARGFIHIHHVVNIADRGEEYTLNPIKDLVPLCPNCHAAIHLSDGKMTVEELREMVVRNR